MAQSVRPLIEARRAQMFPVLEPDEIDRLARFGERRSYAAGERMVTTGEIAPGAFVVLRGRVDVTQREPHGESELIVTHGAGSFQGELAQLLQYREMMMSDECRHTDGIRDVMPSALGCEECLKIGSEWLHLRLCRICGHVGCCDNSPNRHATKHFHATRHPIIEAYDPPDGWGWCYVDEVMLDLTDRPTPHNGPIPRYY